MPGSKQERGNGSSCVLPEDVMAAKNSFGFKERLNRFTEKKSIKGY